ncbi:imidazole glycerol phosphate synthase subunit HisH [Pseudoclavibacter sp. 13-3]|uniref:imidazole glycerol phosphate synthase subunit HisH n=1 Tax=Pseudoclavibacter sp. 13-3 TaxID=2901228 RepID=UPI001E506433|nr:imidazole glycerol phosphate synthase subunit HisH [Pseudoclavibacter sp. 13-3]
MSARPTVAVLDYGSGNVHSAAKALTQAGAVVRLTRDKSAVLAADGLLVPGVGAFGAVMDQLNDVGAPQMIERRLAGGRPVLGICVGMQVMFDGGVEGETEHDGLAQWPGTVTRLQAPVLPHMGWNTVQPGEDSRLFAGIENERFYFVHTFAAKRWTLQTDPPFPQPVVTTAAYGEPFLAAVENGALCATQFHPEKSGRAGIRLLRNWLGTLPNTAH